MSAVPPKLDNILYGYRRAPDRNYDIGDRQLLESIATGTIEIQGVKKFCKWVTNCTETQVKEAIINRSLNFVRKNKSAEPISATATTTAAATATTSTKSGTTTQNGATASQSTSEITITTGQTDDVSIYYFLIADMGEEVYLYLSSSAFQEKSQFTPETLTNGVHDNIIGQVTSNMKKDK